MAGIDALTNIQRLALIRAATSDGRIFRLMGGFWISRGVEIDQHGLPVRPFGKNRWEVWCEWGTIKALEKRGYLQRTKEQQAEWGDTRTLTRAGWQFAADQLSGASPSERKSSSDA